MRLFIPIYHISNISNFCSASLHLRISASLTSAVQQWQIHQAPTEKLVYPLNPRTGLIRVLWMTSSGCFAGSWSKGEMRETPLPPWQDTKRAFPSFRLRVSVQGQRAAVDQQAKGIDHGNQSRECGTKASSGRDADQPWLLTRSWMSEKASCLAPQLQVTAVPLTLTMSMPPFWPTVS